MSREGARDDVAELLRESDAAFAAGDADAWADCFSEDGRMLLLHRDPLDGPTAIREAWRGFFTQHDTSAWEPATDIVDVHGNDAYVFRTYTERLLSRADGARTLVRGRLVYFLRNDGAGWRIRLLMNSHSQPMEPIQ